MKKLFFLLLFCLTPWAQAETIGPALIKDDVCGFYNVVHINGVGTLPMERQEI